MKFLLTQLKTQEKDHESHLCHVKFIVPLFAFLHVHDIIQLISG